jgi:hypothetical protein
MVTPRNPLLDIMHRTMENLKFVKRHATARGPYEVTQLINSFLGALAHPWETLQPHFKSISISDAEKSGWPSIRKELSTDHDPQSLADLIGFIRNGIAHGNIEFVSGSNGDIRSIRIENKEPRNRQRTWGAIVTIDDMDKFLERFVEAAEKLYK